MRDPTESSESGGIHRHLENDRQGECHDRNRGTGAAGADAE